ncbi:uncharacterized protein BJ212DRAFT_1576072 [Suillus subaureus]|uniref:Major facilitator superfamily (MFS) profile domain-containing protein n=1 Tax=Suillus subaureus TaxID=48587 RepID=A0A9P7JES4_9AGAM|nr:uncharacterized protein BJ212DRAFT_1576072 [Suillus subaureus]KAG1819029.1 hypothetical protein BJ212DRAFT_1576072 [Suillus subaureus]
MSQPLPAVPGQKVHMVENAVNKFVVSRTMPEPTLKLKEGGVITEKPYRRFLWRQARAKMRSLEFLSAYSAGAELYHPIFLTATSRTHQFTGVDIAFRDVFRDVQPLFFATPLEFGGLGLDPPRIGNILAIYSVINGLFQILFFADLYDRFGPKIIYSAAMATGIPTIISFPILNAVARVQGLSLMVWTPTTCSLNDIKSGVFLRIYLYRDSISEPSVFWCNEWDCSAGSVDRASHQPRIRYICVLAIYQESRPRMDYLLLFDCSGLHRDLHIAVPSSVIMEESMLTTLMSGSKVSKGAFVYIE